LIERPDIVNWRCNYLPPPPPRKKGWTRSFCIDETLVDANLTLKKCWQNNDIGGISTTVGASNRLIVIHIGLKNGFIEGAELIFKAGTASGDYHGQMNSVNFEKWLNEKVIPNPPLNSVVVMDNAPYGRQEDKPPSKTALKKT
jgi:hypothetical protein